MADQKVPRIPRFYTASATLCQQLRVAVPLLREVSKGPPDDRRVVPGRHADRAAVIPWAHGGHPPDAPGPAPRTEDSRTEGLRTDRPRGQGTPTGSTLTARRGRRALGRPGTAPPSGRTSPSRAVRDTRPPDSGRRDEVPNTEHRLSVTRVTGHPRHRSSAIGHRSPVIDHRSVRTHSAGTSPDTLLRHRHPASALGPGLGPGL
ncbi:hypothetical protein GCM10018785_00040 [Streptomyces longispororuber]|uniref:Uncharacterized protein n=1 Tax=Streptomyces longispororuber TaxID=68230 RepID=A0A918Z368_9ACTN|nr:hypothetical protein GCM10018785_00040 [Streptomyces longispororuber]